MSRRHRWSAIVAHALVVIGLGSSVAQVVLNPSAVVAGLLPWGLASLALPVVALLVGWILALRRPRLSLGWILIAIGVLVSTESAIGALGGVLVPTAPAVARWLLWYGGVDQWAWIPPIGLLFTQVPLRFPDGLLPSPGWRWFSAYTMVAIAVTCVAFSSVERTVARGVPNPTYGPWAADALVAIVPGAMIAIAFIGSIASLVVRYRRSPAAARAQLRWIFWAAAVVASLLILSWFGDYTKPGVAGVADLVVASAAALAYSLIPLAILFAVLRYRLYEIDRIISRTAAYAAVTLTVVVTYAAVVLVVGALLPAQQSTGVALATLAAAGVFLPVLRRARQVVDRIFNRAQYNAERVVEAFGVRIRNGADPHAAGDDLTSAITETLQPSTIGLWVRS